MAQRENAGFTLLEIMISMLILGMVVAMVSLALSGSIKAIEATLDQGNVYYRAQVAFEQIIEDLSNAVLPEGMEFISGQDGSTLLSFASFSHLSFEEGPQGLYLITYALQADRQEPEQLLLLRAEVPYRPSEEEAGEQEAFIVVDRLRSAEFTFQDSTGEEQEHWDSTGEGRDDTQIRRLPVALICRLEFWLEEEQSVTFQTTALLPVGLIQIKAED
jgi:prepilin-type N-terminal cleavage/methylation domain-containing protein